MKMTNAKKPDPWEEGWEELPPPPERRESAAEREAWESAGAEAREASLERQTVALVLKSLRAPSWATRVISKRSLDFGRPEGLTLVAFHDLFGHLLPVSLQVARSQRFVSLDASDIFCRLGRLPVIQEFLDRQEETEGPMVLVARASAAAPKKKAAGLLAVHAGQLPGDFVAEGRQLLIWQAPKGRGVVCVERLEAWLQALQAQEKWDAEHWVVG